MQVQTRCEDTSVGKSEGSYLTAGWLWNSFFTLKWHETSWLQCGTWFREALLQFSCMVVWNKGTPRTVSLISGSLAMGFISLGYKL